MPARIRKANIHGVVGGRGADTKLTHLGIKGAPEEQSISSRLPEVQKPRRRLDENFKRTLSSSSSEMNLPILFLDETINAAWESSFSLLLGSQNERRLVDTNLL